MKARRKEPATHPREYTMRGIIYLIGLVVVIGAIIAFVF
jgi:hypothetical protein